MRFEWHPEKAAANVGKHGVSFDEASTVFADPLAEVFEDPDHSESEQRLILIGHSTSANLLFVSFVDRGSNTIRIISARPVTPTERKLYEQRPS